MPDNSNNHDSSNDPAHIPTLADKKIDLSAFALMDLDPEEVRKLPRPHADFTEVTRQVLALYPEYKNELRLSEEDFAPDKVAEHIDLAEELIPYAEWLERRAEQVRETRMVHLAESYGAVRRLYQRVQAATEFNPDVGYAFAFLADYFGAGKKKRKKG